MSVPGENRLPENMAQDYICTLEAQVLAKDAEIAELVEALEAARVEIYRACNDAVAKLREVSPEQGWDDGDATAEMRCREIDQTLAKHRSKP